MNDPDNFMGVDINKEFIDIAQKKGLNAEVSDAGSLPFSDEYFDAARSDNVIEHLFPEKAYKMLKEAARVLKPGGYFIISTPLPSKFFWATFTHIKPYPPMAIKKLLRDSETCKDTYGRINDFEIEDIFYWKGGNLSNKILFIPIRLVAFYLPIFRTGYTIILKKKTQILQ
jgi:SAM-dependent methyltransferase